MAQSLRTLIAQYMEATVQMTISTTDKDQPWNAVVFYAFDDAFNMYFLSDQRTRHCREITNNPKVAVSISMEWNEPSLVRGLQIQGNAQVTSVNELVHAFDTYVRRFPNTKAYISDTNVFLDKLFNTRIFKVTPIRIFLLDEVNFGPGRRRVLHVASSKEEDANLPS